MLLRFLKNVGSERATVVAVRLLCASLLGSLLVLGLAGSVLSQDMSLPRAMPLPPVELAQYQTPGPRMPPEQTTMSGPIADEGEVVWSEEPIYTQGQPGYGQPGYSAEPWTFQLLPKDLLYRSYLAGEKESRLSTVLFNEKDQGPLWDATLGARVGLFRFGTEQGPQRPEGWQFDVETSAQIRQDPDEEMDVLSADFRVGVPISYAVGAYQTRFGYYHLSSHLQDEFIIKNPLYVRRNYVRDSILWGHSYFLNDDFRVYGEVAWAFKTDGGAEPWEVMFGAEYSPAYALGPQGAPFAAAHVHLREDFDYSGTFVFQTGWQWRGQPHSRLVRAGLHYLNGKTNQFAFYDQNEQQIGGGLWYDF